MLTKIQSYRVILAVIFVLLGGTSAVAQVLVPQHETFDDRSEFGTPNGWMLVSSSGGAPDPGTQLRNDNQGGNPGRWALYTDQAASESFIQAPLSFRGDWSELDGKVMIRFDHNLLLGSGLPGRYAIHLKGPGGEAHWQSSADAVEGGWTGVDVDLVREDWQVVSGSWSTLLDNVQEFRIGISVATGAETSGIDNVRLELRWLHLIQINTWDAPYYRWKVLQGTGPHYTSFNRLDGQPYVYPAPSESPAYESRFGICSMYEVSSTDMFISLVPYGSTISGTIQPSGYDCCSYVLKCPAKCQSPRNACMESEIGDCSSPQYGNLDSADLAALDISDFSFPNCCYFSIQYAGLRPNFSMPRPRDSDGDGVVDACDNCIGIPNRNQADVSSPLGYGDACPEPSTAVGLIGGMIALAGLGRRSKARARWAS